MTKDEIIQISHWKTLFFSEKKKKKTTQTVGGNKRTFSPLWWGLEEEGLEDVDFGVG